MAISPPGWSNDPERTWSASCELCEEARFTEWFHEDDECWIAECEACYVPMVVWRNHDPSPPSDVRARLHERLATVVQTHWFHEHYVDEDMRTIPSHYHAHARPKGGFMGHGLPRRTTPPTR